MKITGQIEDLLNKFNSRLERVESKLDTIDSDRVIFENIQGRLTSLEEQWKLTRQHDIESKKDITYEINRAGDKTAEKVETGIKQVQSIIESGQPIKKKIKKNLFERIKSKLNGFESKEIGGDKL